MGNFEYIKEFADLQELHEACDKAENMQNDKPKESAENCRRALEHICRLVMRKSEIAGGDNMDLSTMLDTEALATTLTDMDVYNQIRQVRKRSNMAINLNEDLDGMPYVVEMLFHIAGAVLVSLGYIKKIPDYLSDIDRWEIPEDVQ